MGRACPPSQALPMRRGRRGKIRRLLLLSRGVEAVVAGAVATGEAVGGAQVMVARMSVLWAVGGDVVGGGAPRRNGRSRLGLVSSPRMG